MNKTEALRVVTSLFNGVHPVTGEIFLPDSPYQHPDVVRALCIAGKALKAQLGSEQDQPEPTPPAGAARPQQQQQRTDARSTTQFNRWTPEEEERLCAGYDAGKSTADLAAAHARTDAAVQARLLKLGKIDPSQLTVQLRYSPQTHH